MIRRGEAGQGAYCGGGEVFFLYSFLFLKRNHSDLPNIDG